LNREHLQPTKPFGPLADGRTAVVLLAALPVITFFFNSNPQIDLAVSDFFHDPVTSFTLARDPLLVTFREIGHALPLVLVIAAVLANGLRLVRGASIFDAQSRLTTVLLATALVWPLAIVNGLLKAQIGRPRPFSVTEFGGTMDFTAAGDWAGQCVLNCSFVSGEASGAALLPLAALLAPPRIRTASVIVLGGIGIGIALLRVAFGRHFLSDAIIGFVGTIAVFALLAFLAQSLERRRLQGVPAH
jgi:lipid A 4'-phosphatase